LAAADDEPVRLIDAAGAQAEAIVAQLQTELSHVNPDAVIEWCPIVLRAVTDRPLTHSQRFGAACQIQDGVVPRRIQLCDDSTGTRFAFSVGEVDDRAELSAFIERHCPDSD
jgi:hypothetical protein